MSTQDPTLFEDHAAVEVSSRPSVPAKGYQAVYVEPVRRLNESLADVLDLDANPDRTPDEAFGMLKSAVETFVVESESWL